MRLLRVPLALIHLVGWALCLRHHPVIALGFLAFYIHSMIPAYRAFWATYPYMFSLRNLLAAVAVDFSPIPIGLWGILTINTDSWVHGDGTNAKKQPGIATRATGRLGALVQATGDAAGQPPVPGEVRSSNGKSMKPDSGSDQTKDAAAASSEAAEQADRDEFKKER